LSIFHGLIFSTLSTELVDARALRPACEAAVETSRMMIALSVADLAKSVEFHFWVVQMKKARGAYLLLRTDGAREL
jgi:hypothetical protein